MGWKNCGQPDARLLATSGRLQQPAKKFQILAKRFGTHQATDIGRFTMH